MFSIGTIMFAIKSCFTYTEAALIPAADTLKAEPCFINHPFTPGWMWGVGLEVQQGGREGESIC